MSYRNILVEIDSSPAGKARLASAVSIARRFDCVLTGAFLKSHAVPGYAFGEGVPTVSSAALERFIEERSEETGRASAAARALFDEAVRDANLSSWWLDLNGDDASDLIACARRHDLAVFPSVMTAALGHREIRAAEIGMASGGPILVLPKAGYPTDFGRCILVAWKDSRESARALRDAWPFLSRAEEIVFLTVSRTAEAEMDELLQRHLRLHGCKTAKMVVDRDDDVPVGEMIRQRIDLVGADMVVMGLYGHSRLQQFVLGGVSRDLLSATPMPLLVSH